MYLNEQINVDNDDELATLPLHPVHARHVQTHLPWSCTGRQQPMSIWGSQLDSISIL